MIEFPINGVEYRAGNMDVFTQFHVSRRLPALLVGNIVTRPKAVEPEEVVFMYTMAFRGMENEDAEFILRTCLGVVYRKQDTGWAPVQAKGGGLMFSDISMDTMIMLVDAVIVDNLSRFMPAPQPLPTDEPKLQE